MAHFRTTVESAASPSAAHALVADFSNIADWDPGVVSAERLDSGQLGVGSRFRVVTAFGPRRIPLEYEVLEWDFDHRAVLEARTRDFRSYDVISTAPTPLGSAVTYDALLELNGLRKVLDPALNVTFQLVGRRAEAGMRRALRAAAAR
ncbi:MAG: SRPBCC family protein [Candidatus Nanopelagicales bacterium]|nr:SRPBCC family protein [Candidatus Nanopelagicales bacterium]